VVRASEMQFGGEPAEWREGAEVPSRDEWLIAEWPEDHPEPTRLLLSNLPADAEPQRLVRLARMRWKMELDYKQLKGELGLDHYEGRSRLGWYHHTGLVTAAHGFLTLERLNPFPWDAGLTLPKAVLLMQPIFKCWTGRCKTCRQKVDLTCLPLQLPRRDNEPNKALLSDGARGLRPNARPPRAWPGPSTRCRANRPPAHWPRTSGSFGPP
jgi:hypothetical protein